MLEGGQKSGSKGGECAEQGSPGGLGRLRRRVGRRERQPGCCGHGCPSAFLLPALRPVRFCLRK